MKATVFRDEALRADLMPYAREGRHMSMSPAGNTGEKDGGDVAHWPGDCHLHFQQTIRRPISLLPACQSTSAMSTNGSDMI